MSSPQSNANGPQGIDYLPVRNGNALKYLRVKADGIGLEWITVTTGEANTSSNVGTGEGLAKAKVGVDLPFKSLLGQTNKIVLTGNTNDVTITIGSDVVLTGDARLSDARTPLAHTHTQSEVTNLTTDLGNKQPLDNSLTEIAGLTLSNDNILQQKVGVLTNVTPAQFKNDLLLVKADVGLSNVVDVLQYSASNRQTAIVTSEVSDAQITNDKLANMATKTFKGRTNAGTGVPEDLSVTTLKTDLSLNNVDNTSDAGKPISTATQTALDLKENSSNKGAVSGYASLTVSQKHLSTEIPFGSAINTVCQGNDSRLSDSRTPLAHTHVKADVTDFAHTHPKTEISDTGTWEVAEIPTLTRVKISDFLPIITSDISDDNVTYAKIQNVAADDVFLGRISGAGGDIEELTGTQATSLLNNFTDALKGLVPLSGGGTANFLRADGTWQPPSAGSGTDWVLLVTTEDKTIPANNSLIVGDFYEIGSGFVLEIGNEGNLTIE